MALIITESKDELSHEIFDTNTGILYLISLDKKVHLAILVPGNEHYINYDVYQAFSFINRLQMLSSPISMSAYQEMVAKDLLEILAKMAAILNEKQEKSSKVHNVLHVIPSDPESNFYYHCPTCGWDGSSESCPRFHKGVCKIFLDKQGHPIIGDKF